MKIWKASDAAERWKECHFNIRTGCWKAFNTETIYNAIVAANGDIQKINAAIGNNSWTRFNCSECDKHQNIGVEFDNWDGGTVVVCASCLKKSVELCSPLLNA